ncbi:MFS transporter permease [Streptomyces uncialis]|uniref:MFS transporter permease n=2 Tax=Streptomyces uncialis TaxID=1048205 RepID=A0A1Q4VBL7_9ACTN|nr:MFS transporter [Streptomyces uncialis]OKH95216.1 MFS transporter permease [Streptomyces uncialis]
MPDRPAPAEGLFSREYAAATSLFAAVMFLTGLAALAVVPTLPTAARDLDGVSLFPLVAGCFVAASLLGGVLGGHWADRAGAHRPLALGMALAVVTLLVSGASTSIWQLAAGRFLDGLAAGMVAVAINTAIGQAYPDRLRPRALALMSTCWIVPSLVGPPLAGLVAETWSWRAVFLGLAALTLVPALAVVALLRGPSWRTASAPPPDGAPRPALLVAAAVSVGAALGQYGVSGWDARHLLFTVGGLVLLVAFAPRLLPRGTWRAVRGLPATVLLCGLGSGVFFTLEALVPLFLVTEREVPPLVIGLAFTGAALAWAASSAVQGRLLERAPRHRLVVAGALVQGVAVAVAAVGTLPGAPDPVAASAMVVAAVGMGMYAPSLTVLALSHSPRGRQGYASSSMQTSQNLGQVTVLALGSGVFNAFLGAGSSGHGGYRAAFVLLLVPCAVAALLAVRTRAA